MGDWRGKRVLVTGAGGFIGARLVERLSMAGATVVSVVRSMERAVLAELLDRSIVEIGDVTDFDRMRGIVSQHEIEYVFHLASCAIVRLSARDPMTTYRTNIMGTVAVLEACRSVGGVRRIVAASSDKAYGDHEDLPYVEGTPLEPRNTYDTSKACGDMIARSYAHNYGMDVFVTRCSNVYGPGDRNFSRIIPNTIRRVLEGKPPMLYSDIEKMEREFIYIDDVVDAYLLLGQVDDAEARDVGQRAFNVGGGGMIQIGGLSSLICQRMGKEDMRPEIVPRELSFREIQKQCIDAKLLEVLGWKRNVSLVEGLDRTIDWYGSLK